MSLRATLLTALILFGSGCMAAHAPTSPLQADPAPPPVVSPRQFVANWKGDLLLRFDIQADAGTTCKVHHEASGQFAGSGDHLLFIAQDTSGGFIHWWGTRTSTMPHPQVEANVGGQPIQAGLREREDHWAVAQSPQFEVPAGGLVLTFIARNLQPWPESPGPKDSNSFWSGNRSHTISIVPECDAPWSAGNIHYGREVFFFDADSFNGTTTARAYTEDQDHSTASVVSGGTLTHAMDGARVETFAWLYDSRGNIGNFHLAYPDGDQSWTLAPSTSTTSMMHVVSRAGPYTMNLDWVGAGSTTLTGAFAEVTPIVRFPPQ